MVSALFCARGVRTRRIDNVSVCVQVEVAFKEQTAGHNALLLLTHLALSLMKGQLQAAALDVRARQAQVFPLPHLLAASHQILSL